MCTDVTVRSNSASDPTGPPADPALFIGGRAVLFGVVSLALVMSTLDQTIVATALSDLEQGLHTSITWAGWTITAYSLGLVLTLSARDRAVGLFGSFFAT